MKLWNLTQTDLLSQIHWVSRTSTTGCSQYCGIQVRKTLRSELNHEVPGFLDPDFEVEVRHNLADALMSVVDRAERR